MSFFYRAHSRILAKATDLNGSLTAAFKLGIAGPLQVNNDYGQRPNYIGGTAYALSRRGKLSDFTASDFSNDGGLLADDVRAIMGYARQAMTPVITRDHFGAIATFGWLQLASRISWAPHGTFPAHTWLYDSLPPAKIQQFPWTTPKVASSWWTGGNPWSVDCETCAGLPAPLWMMSVPAHLAYVTIDTGEDEEACFATLCNGHDWYRVGGGLNARASLRVGAPYCSGDFAFQLLTRLVAGGSSPWSSFKYVALAVAADAIAVVNTIPLAQVPLAFAEMFDVDWSITPYSPDTWTVSDPETDPPDIPEVLPFAALNITEYWNNTTDLAVKVKGLGVAGYNDSASRWELLFWGPLVAEETVRGRLRFSGGNWTNASKRISAAGAFADYAWQSGDQVHLSAGTGVSVGDFDVASKIDSNTIELTSDINGGAGDIPDGTVAGYILGEQWRPAEFKLKLTDRRGN